MARWQLGSLVLALALVFPAEAGATQVRQAACSRKESLWARAAHQSSRDYCNLVDRARARLNSDPKQASAISKKAMQLRGNAVEARVVHAHALQLLGESKRAHEEFTLAVPDLGVADLSGALSPSSVTMGARAALFSGEYGAALQRYRWVVLRLAELESESEEARVLIEAATAAMYDGPAGFREAHAYLAQAAAKNAPLQRPIAEAVRVLALFREGQRERSAVLGRRFESSWGIVWMFEGQPSAVGSRGEALPVLPPGEFWALAAAVAEAVEPQGAEMHWNAFHEAGQEHLPLHLRRGGGR